VKEVLPAPVATPALKNLGNVGLCEIAKAAYAQWVMTAGGAKKAESPSATTHDHVADHEEPHEEHGDQAPTVRICRWPDVTPVQEEGGREKCQYQGHDERRRRARLVELPASLGVLSAGEHLRAAMRVCAPELVHMALRIL
jgi:hypothetical protein